MVKLTRLVLLFVVLLAFWQVLSGQTSAAFISLGVLCASGVTWFSLRLLEALVGSAERTPRLHVWHFAQFIVWLLLQIPPAALQIAVVILDPRRPPRPGVVRFKTRLSSPAARTLLCNSITLVPGTMTLNIEGSEITVHAFAPAAVAELATADFQKRIARAFRQDYDPVPTLVWEPVHDAVTEDPR